MTKEKKILLVEDDLDYQRKYAEWLRELGYEVLIAESVRQGIALAGAEMPVAIITDHGLNDGTGNELARAVKSEYKVPIAGFTAGDPRNFSEEIDIKESKEVSKTEFSRIVGYLFTENPRKKYEAEKIRIPSSNNSRDLITAASILFQGYYLASALKNGLEEIVVDGKVEISKAEIAEVIRSIGGTNHIIDPKNLFRLFREANELSPNTVYTCACEAYPQLSRDMRFKAVFDKLETEDYNLTLEESVYAKRKLNEILTAEERP